MSRKLAGGASRVSSLPPVLDVLLVTGCVPPVPCGVGHYAARLREALEAAGVRAGIEVVGHGAELNRLSERVAAERPPVVHVMYPTRGYGRRLFPLKFARAVRPARMLLHVHEYTNNHWLRRMLVRAMAKRAWRVVVTTEYEREALARFDPRVVPLGATVVADPARLPALPKPRASPEPVEVVFFGFITPKKGVATLIEACSQTGARLRLLGETPPDFADYAESMARLAESKGVALERAGAVPDDRVVHEIQRSDICALPFGEGASARHTTLFTALASGVPVITTTGADVATGLRDGENALLIPPGSVNALSAALKRLANDPALRGRLGANGRALASRVGWPDIAKAFAEIYRE